MLSMVLPEMADGLPPAGGTSWPPDHKGGGGNDYMAGFFCFLYGHYRTDLSDRSNHEIKKKEVTAPQPGRGYFFVT